MAAMTAMNTPAQAEAPRRALGWAMAARIGLPVLLFVGLASPAPRADDWGGLVTVSATMGVNDGRLCMGEGSRGDIGCPANAPYVSRTTGYVGIGTNAPVTPLHIKGPLTIEDNTGGVRTLTVSASPDGILHTIKSSNSMAGYQFSNMAGPLMTIGNYGHVGISTTNPSATLHVFGTLRIANGNENCDTNRTGAIKYESNDFHLCRNGTSWEPLSTIASGGTPDRLISGTSSIMVQSGGVISITTNGTTANYFNTSGQLVTSGISITTANGISSTNGYFSGKIGIGTSPTTYKLDISSSNPGISMRNGAAYSLLSGANDLFLQADEGNEVSNSSIRFQTDNIEHMRIASTGNVGIGTITPTTKLEVAGTVSATTLQLADNPANPCNAANKGMAKVVNGRIYVCRYP